MLTQLLKDYPREKIIHILAHLLTEERIKGIDEVLQSCLRSVQVALEAPYDIHNGFAVIRTAEALGLDHVHFIRPVLGKGSGRTVTIGTTKWIHLNRHETFADFLGGMRGFALAGAVVDGTSSLEMLPADRPLCFLFGNEKLGLSDEARQRCDFLFSIPRYGMAESYNLSVAAAIALFDFTERRRKKMARAGDLTTEEIIEEKASFYIRSLGAEQAKLILERS